MLTIIFSEESRRGCVCVWMWMWIVWTYFHVSTPRPMRLPYVSDGKYTIFYVIDLHATKTEKKYRKHATRNAMVDGSGCDADIEKTKEKKYGRKKREKSLSFTLSITQLTFFVFMLNGSHSVAAMPVHCEIECISTGLLGSPERYTI